MIGAHYPDRVTQQKAAAQHSQADAGKAADKAADNTWIFPTYANTNCWNDYEPGVLLGRGSCGITYQATKKGTSEQYAVKMIAKHKMRDPEAIAAIRNEVHILHHLEGHDSIVQIKGVYEDNNYVCLVMELCSGGELFDDIVKKGRYSEEDAATLLRTIVEVVAHCHHMGVMHRDLKPDNFLLSDATGIARLKAIDFSLSSFFEEGQMFTDMLGSTHYLAPEVIDQHYGKEADLWSCGVILYNLLSGSLPFDGRSQDRIMQQIKTKQVSFDQDPWLNISESAKDCVMSMLERDPKKRATAAQVLDHPWIIANSSPLCRRPSVAESLEVTGRMRKTAAESTLKRTAKKIIAAKLPPEEVAGMETLFRSIDKEHRGHILYDEFATELQRRGMKITPCSEVQRLWTSPDPKDESDSPTATLQFEDFLAATLYKSKMMHSTRIRWAFEHLDADGDGKLSCDDLKQALPVSESELVRIIQEASPDGKGSCIGYTDFTRLMRDL